MNRDKFKIKGLGGKKTMKGEVHINGAKNAVLKVMASSILFKDEVRIENVPFNEDVKKMIDLMKKSGADISTDESKKTITINTSSFKHTDLNGESVKSMRASVVLTGPILGRFGEVSFEGPGGCVIGTRPIDLFIDAYNKMGATILLKNGEYKIFTKEKKLIGSEIFFNIQTVGGTETLMMAAVLAKGKTILKNCAMEPEIVSVAEFLVSCGAKIKGAGTSTIEIEGGDLLEAKGKIYHTIPDRIEAGSFALLGGLLADDMKIINCNPLHLESVISFLKQAGVNISVGKDYIRIKKSVENLSGDDINSYLPRICQGLNIRTHEYPGFPTDLQPQATVFLLSKSCQSQVFETIYEGRFKYTEELIKLGADITLMNPREIIIRGGKKLMAPVNGEELNAHDIRAGFAIVMASLMAEGTSVINNVYFIDRGYENLEEKLIILGASLERIS